MTLVYVGIGSNIDKDKHVAAALRDLDALFPDLRVSPIFESEAVNCTGANYYNLVVAFDCDLSISAINQQLKELEFDHGRKASDLRYAPRTLDLDLLMVGNTIQDSSPILPRPEILHHAFVLWPLAELAPDLVHPVAGKTMKALWQQFDKQSQKLALASLQWSQIKETV